MITIYNEFHGTEARVKLRRNNTISPSQYHRAAKKLCGMKDCQCGVARGPNPDLEAMGVEWLESLVEWLEPVA